MGEGIITVNDETEVISNLVKNNIITAEKVRNALGDEKIKEIIYNKEDAKKVFTDYFKSNKVDFEEYWPLIDLTSLVDKINMDTVVGYASNEETYQKMVVLLSDGNKIQSAVEALGNDTIQGIVKGEGNLSSLFKTGGVLNTFFKYFNRDALVEELGGYAALAKEYKDVIGVEALDTIATTVGGYGELAKRFDTKELLDAIGGASTVTKYVKDDLEPIITELGGFEKLLSYYSEEEISKIIETIGYKNILDFVKDSGLAEKVDLKAIASDVLDLVKSKDEGFKTLGNEIKNRLYKFMMTDVESLSLNGTEIFSAGKFDLNTILVKTAQAIPDVEDFISIGVDGTIASFTLEAEIAGEKYSFGIESSWDGDPAELNAFVEGYKEYFKLDVSDDLDVTLSAIAPSALSDIYETVLTSNKVPSTLKEALLTLPTGDVNGVISFLKDLDESEIKAIHEAVAPKIDTISDKAYAAIDKIDTISAPAADKLKSGVDQIVDAFSSPEKLEGFIDNTVNKIDSKIPTELKDRKIMEFYAGDGLFELEKSFEVDLYEKINNVISLPEEIKILFTGNDMTVSGTVDTDFSLGDIYRLRLITDSDEPMDIFLPAGVSLLDVLKNVPTLADDLPKGIYDVDLNDATSMPKGDATFYSTEVYEVIFPDGTVVRYPYGATKEDLLTKEPPLPEEDGYTFSWEYDLSTPGNVAATLVKTPNEYKIKYVDENGAPIIDGDGNECNFPYLYGTYTPDELKELITNNAPQLKGHTTNVTFPDDFDPNAAKNQSVTVTYAAIEYKVTYVDENGAPIPDEDGNECNFSYLYGAYTPDELKEHITNNAPQLKGHDANVTFPDDFDPDAAENQSVTVTYTAIEYELTYKTQDGSIEGGFKYTYGATEQDIQSEILSRITIPDGYTVSFSKFNAELDDDQEITITFTGKTYTFTFTDSEKKPIYSFEFVFGTLTDNLVRSKIPAKTGHSADVSDYNATVAGDISAILTYVPNKYKVTFMAEDKETIIEEVIFTYGDKTLSKTPNVPEKLGYTGKWSDYTLGDKNITVYPEYSTIKYTAKFVYEDGSIYKEFIFTVETESLEEPPVPPKEGYTGKWESYTLGTSDITIRPIYTPIAVDEPDTPDTPDTPDDSTPTTPVDDEPAGCNGVIWWIIVAVLFIIIVILVVIYLLRKKIFDDGSDDDNTPPPTTPDPVPEPEAEEEEVEEDTTNINVMEDVTPESADEIMTDEEALATVETVSAADSSKKQTNDGYKTFVNIEDISAAFAPGDTVDLASLKAHGLVPQKTTKVKILAKGHLDKPLTVVANKFSVQAIKMIVLTGGKAIITK